MIKNLYLFLLLLFALLKANAQNFQWAKHSGGPGEDFVNAIAFDKDDNSYIVGSNSANSVYGNITLTKGGFLVKYNSVGEVVWGKSFKGTGEFVGPFNSSGNVKDVCLDHDNNIYIVGTFSGDLIIEGEKLITSRGTVDSFIAKLDKDGKLIWYKRIGGARDDNGNAITIDKFKNVYITGSLSSNVLFDNTQTNETTSSANGDLFIAKFNANGSFNFARRVPSDGVGKDIEIDISGNIYFTGLYQSTLDLTGFGLGILPASNGLYLGKFNSGGQLLWFKTSKILDFQTGHVSVNGLLLDGKGSCYVQGNYTGTLDFDNNKLPYASNKSFLAKFSTATGTDNWLRQLDFYSYTVNKTFAVDSTGNIFLGGSVQSGQLEGKPIGFGRNDFVIAKYSPLGKVSWIQGINTTRFTYLTTLTRSKSGKIGVAGYFHGNYSILSLNQFGSSSLTPSGESASADILTAVIKDVSALPKPNIIYGNIFEDLNSNCLADNFEIGVAGILIKAEPGPYFGLTDSLGKFSIVVDSGTFLVSPVFPANKGILITQICPANNSGTQVKLNGYGQKAENINYSYQVNHCTSLTIDITADRRRRCFRGKTTVTYTNEGAADAQNVKIKVIYPKYVVPISSTFAWASKQDSALIFNIGSLKAGERRSFVITDSTVCGNEQIRGLSQCVKAIISPQSTCTSPSTNWDQSSVAVYANVVNNEQTASFTVANEGTANMTDSTAYRLYANAALVKKGKVKLAKGATAKMEIPMPIATLRLEADQVLNHPGQSRPTVSLQPLAVPQAMAAPTPIDNAYQDDANADVEISCLQIIDSYDPNDKQVSPQGISKRHYIKAEDELEYLIRFQNTGTDTAYTVVVKDTLSSFVDIASLRVGSASHPFTYTVSGKGKPVLTFTFKNINLPDHKKNEPASHGYIKFSIPQMPNNPKGTKIKNIAYNYFDFNSPIATNEVFNIIGDTLIALAAKVVVYDCGKEMPTVAQASPVEIKLCETNTTTLQANAPTQGLGKWKIISGTATLSDPTNPKATVTNIGYGEVVLEWTITLCEKISKSQVKIYRYAIPPAPTLTNLPLQCEGSALMPISGIGSSITWYADAQKQQKLFSGNSFIPAATATTTFYATQTVNGCESATSSVTVNIHHRKINSITKGDTLMAPTADNYQWYFNDAPIKEAIQQKYVVKNMGHYRLKTTTNGCEANSENVEHIITLAQSDIKLGPNPVQDKLYLTFASNNTGEVKSTIRDSLGKQIKTLTIQKTTTILEQTVDVETVAPGVYIMEVQIGKERHHIRFVKL